MQKHARVRRWVLGLSLVALAVVGVARRPAAQGQFVNITIHMVAEPTLSGRVGTIPLGNLCDVNDQVGVLQPNGDRTSQCTYQIASGTVLRLNSNVPDQSGMPGVFSNPTGSANCGPYSTCQFTISQDSEVTATFSNSTLTYTMTVNLAGAPGEVDTDNSRCQNYDYHPANLPTQGTECVTRYARGSVVTSAAAAPVGSRFVTFLQGTNDAAVCGMDATCAFPLSADTSLTGSFSALTSLAVAPSTATIGIGDTQLFTQSATYADGVSAPLPPFHMGTWTTKTSMSQARYSFGAASVGNRIYAIGGSSVSGPLDSTEVFDPSANGGLGSWSPTASVPSPLAGLGVGTIDDRYIYAVGGSTTNACPVDTLLRYDTVTDAWETKTPMPGGPRRFLTSAVVGRTLYAIGGELNLCNTTVGTTLNRVEAYDIDSDTWTSKAPLPTGRRFLASGVVHGIIYVVGGDDAGNPSVSATVDAYDPASNTWSARAPLPNGRTLLAAGVIDDVLYAVGGNEAGSYRTSLYAYDASTNTWSNKLPIPAVRTDSFNLEFGGERAELAVASLGGQLYAIGGLGGPGPSNAQNIPYVLAFSDNLIWSTGDATVAGVDQNFQNGLAHGLNVGSTAVVARSGAITCAPGACGALTVTNGPPGVNVGSPNPRTIQEGQSITVSGSFSDLASDGPWTASISFGDGSPSESLGSFTSAGFFNSSSHQYKDNGTFNAVVSVTDSHGNTGTGTLQVIVTNVAPQVFLGTSASVNVGSTSPFTCATFSDPGVNDGPWTAIADFGDGTGPQAVTGGPCGGGGGNPPTGSFLLSHAYSHAGTFTLTVTISDKDGGSGSSTMQVTVNLAQISLGIPTATSTQVNNANWGCGTFSDPNGGSWTGSINYGDGSGTQGLPLSVPASSCSGGGSPTGSFSFNHAYSTPGTFTVNLTITNTTTGGSKSGAVTVTVNAAQIFLNLPGSASTQVNSSSNFGCGSFSDSNGGSWTGSVNYGDGTGNHPLNLIIPPSGSCNFGGGNTGVFAFNHAYHTPGTFPVSVTITNTVTGGSKSGGFNVTVNLSQMFLNIPGSGTTQVNSPFTACGSFSDPNGGSWTGTVNYGDGSGNQSLALVIPPSGPCFFGGTPTGVFQLSHTYHATGTFPVSVTIANTVTGGTKSGGFNVTVNAAQMSVGLPSSASINVDENNWACGAFSDPNGGSWMGTVNYGDGSGSQPLTLVVPPSGPCVPVGGGTPTGVFSLDHAYSVGGTFQVSVTILNTVTGMSKSNSFLVTVTDNRCAQVTVTVSGNVPFTTLPVSVTFNGVLLDDANAVEIGTNVLKLTTGEDGTYHVQFLPPAGYTVSPDHLDFTVVCGTNLAFSVVVAVADTTPPVLTLNGANPMTVEAGSSFTDPGATATDAVDGNLTASIQVSGSVNPNLAGTYTLTYTVSDHAGNQAFATRTVIVHQTPPPTITSLAPSQGSLWPPNHTYHAVSLTAAAVDADGQDVSASCKIISVSSNEPDNGLGDGDTANDIVVTGLMTVNLRAERSGSGSGRIYTITVQCTDAGGRTATRTTTVTVAHNQ